MLLTILAIAISYLVGSIPTAYIFVRAMKGLDIRKCGSGNVGATNALRLLGRGWGITILLLDIVKGFLPVVLLGSMVVQRSYLIQDQNIFIIIGLAAICGHNWPVFLGFKGGKGVATTLGVLLGLAFKIEGLGIVLLVTVFAWIVTFLITRFISLSSITAAISFPVFTIVFKLPLLVILLGTLLSLFILLRHKPNIKRLYRGEEPRLSFKK